MGERRRIGREGDGGREGRKEGRKRKGGCVGDYLILI